MTRRFDTPTRTPEYASAAVERRRRTAPVGRSTALFESYVDLLRMLLPQARKVCFYDHTAAFLWSSDGSDSAELQAQAEQAFTQPANAVVHASGGERASYVAVVRGPDDAMSGAVACALGQLPGTHAARPLDPDRVLGPWLRIVGHALHEPQKLTSKQNRRKSDARATNAPLVGPARSATSAQVLFRRALAKAMDSVSCDFGAIIATEPATLTHRGTGALSATQMREIVTGLHRPLTNRSGTQRQALFVDEGLSPQTTAYRLLVFPLRTSDDPGAFVALFRLRTAPPFTAADGAALADRVANMPVQVIDEVAPRHNDAPAAATLAPRIELSMEQRVRNALRSDGFNLYAQLLAPLRESDEHLRYEVLLRMREADAVHLPVVFMAAATSAGLLPELDRWVIGRFLNTTRIHAEVMRTSHCEFALNISAASLLDASFAGFVEAQLLRSNLAAQALTFEFSEHDVLEHRHAFEQLAPRLASLGCRITLDNCRQGLDLFLAIGRLPVHRLKIDAALTHHIATDERAACVVRELVEVASDIGVETVGERIEDENAYFKLKELGVDFAQGFYLSQPEPLGDVLN